LPKKTKRDVGGWKKAVVQEQRYFKLGYKSKCQRRIGRREAVGWEKTTTSAERKPVGDSR